MTVEEKRQFVLDELNADIRDVETAILSLSAYGVSMEALLAELADLHNKRAQEIYGISKHFNSRILYAPRDVSEGDEKNTLDPAFVRKALINEACAAVDEAFRGASDNATRDSLRSWTSSNVACAVQETFNRFFP